MTSRQVVCRWARSRPEVSVEGNFLIGQAHKLVSAERVVVPSWSMTVVRKSAALMHGVGPAENHGNSWGGAALAAPARPLRRHPLQDPC